MCQDSEGSRERWERCIEPRLRDSMSPEDERLALSARARLFSIRAGPAPADRDFHDVLDALHRFLFQKPVTRVPRIILNADRSSLIPNQSLEMSDVYLSTLDPDVVLEELLHFSCYHEYVLAKPMTAEERIMFSTDCSSMIQHVIVDAVVKMVVPELHGAFIRIKVNDELLAILSAHPSLTLHEAREAAGMLASRQDVLSVDRPPGLLAVLDEYFHDLVGLRTSLLHATGDGRIKTAGNADRERSRDECLPRNPDLLFLDGEKGEYIQKPVPARDEEIDALMSLDGTFVVEDAKKKAYKVNSLLTLAVEDGHVVKLSIDDYLLWLCNRCVSPDGVTTTIDTGISLPAEIGLLPGLTELWLGRCNITSMPDSIGNLVNLGRLDLQGNKLTSLPSTLGNLKSLACMHLQDNQLTSLPESIGNLVNLKELHLNGNQLTSLPESIGNLVNLRELHLNGNPLTSLPESFENLVNLEALYLEGTKVTSFPRRITRLLDDMKRHDGLFRFRLTGVPPDQANKMIGTNPDLLVSTIKKIIQKEYNLNPILQIQFIFKGKVLPDALKFSKIGILPGGDAITVMATQAGGPRNPLFSRFDS